MLGMPRTLILPGAQSMRLPGFGMEHYYPDTDNEKVWVPEQLVGKRHELRPIVVLFIGRRGAGKTLALTTTGYIQLRRYLAAKARMKVAANYNVTFGHYKDPYIVDRLQNFPVWARNIYLMVSEIGAAFPGMRSMAMGAIMFTQLLGQLRKRAIEIGADTRFAQILGWQHVTEIDLFIRCEALARLPDGRPRAIRLEVWDYWGQWTGDQRRRYWPPTAEPPDWELVFGNVHHVCKMYNTGEVIAPSFSAARDGIIQQQWNIQEGDIPVALAKRKTVTGLQSYQ